MVAARNFVSAGRQCLADRGDHHRFIFLWDVRLCSSGICLAVFWVWGVSWLIYIHGALIFAIRDPNPQGENQVFPLTSAIRDPKGFSR